MAARLAARYRAACTAAEQRISRWVEPHRGGGPSRNPAAPRNAVSPWEAGAPRAPLHAGRQRQIRGSVPSHGARVLEVRIHLPPADSPSLAGFLLPVSKSRQLPRGARVRPGSTASRDAQGSSTSRQLPVISLSGTNPVPQCRLGALEPGCTAAPRGSDKRCHQALSSVRLRQSRARPSARASQVADANAPAACLRSDRAAGVRRGWLR